MKKVIVYSSENCAYCVSVKEYLTGKGIEFEERNVKIPQYRKELMSMGYMSVPVLKIDESVLVGFNSEEIDALLKL